MSRRSIGVNTAVGVIVAAQLVTLFLVMRDSSWVYDDNFFLLLTGSEGFWRALSAVRYEHWDLAYNAIIALQQRLFFLDYRWGLALMLAVLGLAVVLFERAISLVVSNRWVSIGAAVWFGFSLLWARPLQWWAGGLQYIPYTFFDVVCLYGFLRFHAGGGRRWLVASVAGLAAALLFYEKPAFMLVYLLLIRVLLMSDDLHPRAVAALLWRERWIWLAYIAVVLVWAIGYRGSGALHPHPNASLKQYGEYFEILWLRALVPTLAGVTIPAGHLDALQTLFVALSQVAVIAGILVALLRRPAGWRAWGLLAFVIVLGGVLVVRQRVSIFGVDIADDPRYLIDYSWLVPLCLCAALSRSGRLKPRLRAPHERLQLRLPSPAIACAGVVLAVYAGGATASAVALESNWGGPQARRWEETVRSTLPTVAGAGAHPVVTENIAPFVILSPFTAPYNRLSHVLPPYVGRVQVDGPLDGPLVSLDESGRAHLATFGPEPGAKTLVQMLRTGEASLGASARMVREGAYACVIADTAPVEVSRNVPRPPGEATAAYYAKLTYRSWEAAQLPLAALPYGQPVPNGYAMTIAAGTASSIAWIGDGPPLRVAVTVPLATTICIKGFEVASVHRLG